LNISPFVGHYNQKEDIEGAREILQWIVDTLIRTDVKGELLLKELSIEDCIYCYREEPHMLAHIPDKVADLHLRECYQNSLEALKRRVEADSRS